MTNARIIERGLRVVLFNRISLMSMLVGGGLVATNAQ